MTTRLDEILDALASGTLTTDNACRLVASFSRENPDGTRLWPLLIETRVTQQKLSPSVGRALTEALQNFEPDKTMWLAPKVMRPNNVRSDVLRAPVSKASQPVRSPEQPVDNVEQLRALLWDPPSSPDINASQQIPTLAPPPRKKPGASSALPPLELGAIVKGRYRLDSHLGFGGIGQVFTATDLEAEKRGERNSRVTLKVIAVDLKKEPQALMAMKIAVSKIKPLRHPNIVTTFGIDVDNNRLFITMEPLTGRWLGERIRAVRNRGISPEIVWPIVEGIASGLAYAHRHGIVHSDLSPYSIFLANDALQTAPKITPKIMSFGLIHALPTSNEALDLLDTMTLRAYSEAYIANPWATHAVPRPADDLYPLGVIAYELLSGKHPFQRCPLTTARQKNLTLEPIPGLNRRAAKLIEHCLSFERSARPIDAARFLARMSGPAWLRMIFGERFAVRST